MTDPYATPDAQVIESSSASIEGLPRFSTWAVFFLSMLTLGIYSLYWLYTRVGALNSSIENKVPMALVHGYVGLTILSWVFQLAILSDPEMAQLAIANSVVQIVSLVCFYMVIFKMRNRICDDLLQTERWGGFMTFFFNVLYLNYKINEAHDNA